MSTVPNELYVEVGLGEERYAFRIHEIKEIIRMQPVTELPGYPLYFKGVISLRGVILPVISLRVRFGMPEIPYSRATRTVIIHNANQTAGIIVDQVIKVTRFEEIHALSEQALTPPSLIDGIGRSDTGLVNLLRLDHLLINGRND